MRHNLARAVLFAALSGALFGCAPTQPQEISAGANSAEQVAETRASTVIPEGVRTLSGLTKSEANDAEIVVSDPRFSVWRVHSGRNICMLTAASTSIELDLDGAIADSEEWRMSFEAAQAKGEELPKELLSGSALIAGSDCSPADDQSYWDEIQWGSFDSIVEGREPYALLNVYLPETYASKKLRVSVSPAWGRVVLGEGGLVVEFVGQALPSDYSITVECDGCTPWSETIPAG